MFERMTLNGVPGWLDEQSGRWMPLVAGGDPEGDPSSGEGGSGEGGSGEGGSAGSGGSGESGSGGESGEDEEATISKAELEQLRKDQKELRAAKAAAAQADKRRRREAQEEQKKRGDWEKVVETAERERDDAIRERDEAQAELAEYKQRQVIDATAERRHWKSPRDAYLFLTAEERSGEERVVERALKQIETERPYLVNPAPPSGLPIRDGKKRTGSDNMNDRIRRAAGRI
jgi:hypothetical protein